MANYYFDTPIGLVECEVSDDRVVSKCYPTEKVDRESLVSSRNKFPELADALLSLSPCPVGYTVLGGRIPSFAPHFWAELAKVPFGSRITYAEFALQLGLSKGYARVVGNVLGSNECFILLPCHRIVPANGKIGGFRWGTDVKKKLLEYESAAKEKNF